MNQRRRPGRPPQHDARDLRSALLTTSRALLDEGGPAALSLREVARRTGCTHQAPYHYFDDRESILAALVVDGFKALGAKLSAANAVAATDGVRAAMIRSADAYVRFALAHPGVFRVMFRPDLCAHTRFPAIQVASEAARAELEVLNTLVYGAAACAETASVLWAHVHGLAGLLIDGPLGRVLGTPEARDAHLAVVAVRFADQVFAATPPVPTR